MIFFIYIFPLNKEFDTITVVALDENLTEIEQVVLRGGIHAEVNTLRLVRLVLQKQWDKGFGVDFTFLSLDKKEKEPIEKSKEATMKLKDASVEKHDSLNVYIQTKSYSVVKVCLPPPPVKKKPPRPPPPPPRCSPPHTFSILIRSSTR